MPIYEYMCESCGKRFEITKGIKEDSSSAICLRCKGTGKKVPSLSTFHLKGSGWYSDGYSGKSCDISKKNA